MSFWQLADGTEPALRCDRCGEPTPMTTHGLCIDCNERPWVKRSLRYESDGSAFRVYSRYFRRRWQARLAALFDRIADIFRLRRAGFSLVWRPPSDSRLKREAPRREAGSARKGESGGAGTAIAKNHV